MISQIEMTNKVGCPPFFALTLCYLAMMALAIAINLPPVFLIALSNDMGGLSGEQLGRIGAVTFAGLCLGIVLTGPLADRWGGRPFTVGGNLLLAVGLAAMAAATDYPVILAACFFMGAGAGTLDMILSPIVSALQPARRTAAMNLLHSFYSTGAVVTILVGSLALRWGFGWRSAAWMLAPLPVLVGVAFMLVKLPPLVEDSAGRMPMRVLMRKPYFLLAMVAILLGGATEMGMAYWLPAYAEKTLGFSQWTAGMAFLGFSMAMAFGRIGIILLPKRIGPIELMLTSCILTAILFPLASFASSNSVALVACIAAGLTGSCLWPSTLAVTADRYPHGGATMFAILAVMGNIGGIIMPWIVGFIGDHSTLRYGLATAAACPLLMIVALLWMRKQPEPSLAKITPLPIAEP